MLKALRRQTLQRFLWESVLYFIGVMLIVVLIGLLLGWPRLYDFGSGFFLAAVIALAVGAITGASADLKRNPFFRRRQLPANEKPVDRAGKTHTEAFSEFRFMLQTILVALLCFALSWITQSIPSA